MRDAIALNAGMGLYVAGVSDSVGAGVDKAKEGLASGAGLEKQTAGSPATKARWGRNNLYNPARGSSWWSCSDVCAVPP